MHEETFWDLFTDPAHWWFEITLILIFDVIIGALLWPRFKNWIKHHKKDDDKVAILEKKVRVLETLIKDIAPMFPLTQEYIDDVKNKVELEFAEEEHGK